MTTGTKTDNGSYRSLLLNSSVMRQRSQIVGDTQTLVGNFVASQGGDQLGLIDAHLNGDTSCVVTRTSGRRANQEVTLTPWFTKQIRPGAVEPVISYFIRPSYWNTPISKDGVEVSDLESVREITTRFLKINCMNAIVQQEILNAYYRANKNARDRQNMKIMPAKYGFDEILSLE